jgi:quercetin dioxygenase-like cupin family protein
MNPSKSESTRERHERRQAEITQRLMPFDLRAEAARIPRVPAPEHTARTIVHLDALRLTLITVDAGARVNEHRTDHPLSIQTLSGHVVVHADGMAFDLPQGKLLVVDSGVPHDVEAHEDSTVLVTVSVPEAAGNCGAQSAGLY